MLSDLLERSDNNNEDDDGTCDKDNNCDGNGGGDRNTCAVVGSTEWLRLLRPSALMEALSAMAKDKAYSWKNRENNQSWEKVRIK